MATTLLCRALTHEGANTSLHDFTTFRFWECFILLYITKQYAPVTTNCTQIYIYFTCKQNNHWTQQIWHIILLFLANDDCHNPNKSCCLSVISWPTIQATHFSQFTMVQLEVYPPEVGLQASCQWALKASEVTLTKKGNHSLQTTIISCTVVLDIIISYNKELYQVWWFIILLSIVFNKITLDNNVVQPYRRNTAVHSRIMVYSSLQLMLENGVRCTPGVLNKTWCFLMSSIRWFFPLCSLNLPVMYRIRQGYLCQKLNLLICNVSEIYALYDSWGLMDPKCAS